MVCILSTPAAAIIDGNSNPRAKHTRAGGEQVEVTAQPVNFPVDIVP